VFALTYNAALGGMNGLDSHARPVLRLVQGAQEAPTEWTWFCGHCAAPSPRDLPPSPATRVCPSCGLGLLLESRADTVPSAKDAFLVVDEALLIQAVSRTAEQLLSISEDAAVNRPVAELLVPADAEARGPGSFAGAIADAIGNGDDPVHAFVRPWNTFGVRMRARIAPCGPPRAALLVLDPSPARLHAVKPR
jgi:PAS domain-containing protein